MGEICLGATFGPKEISLHHEVQYDGDLDIEIDEEDLKLDGPFMDKLRD